MSNQVFTDQIQLEKTIEKIIAAGPDRLHVLSDFDRTLTRAYVDGQNVPSLISIFRDHGYLTPDYPEKAKALYSKYFPMENDPALTIDQKKQAMEEWWREHFKLLIKSGLTKADIVKAMNTGIVKLRDGAQEFITTLADKNIPLVIISSSAIGNISISTFLENENLLTKNIHIISNSYQWDDQGRAIEINEPIIHSMNKDETAIQNFPAYEIVKNRKNVILLGDSIGDTGMVTGFDYQNLIKVGFLNEKVDEYFAEYKKYFDIIITDDGNINYINKLIKKL